MKKILPILLIAFSGIVFKGVASPVINQNFSSGFGTWTHTVTGGGGGWALTSGATVTQLGTVPSRAHYVMVNEALLTGSNYNNPATLTTPTFSLAGMTAPYLAFDQWYTQAYLSSTGTPEKAWINLSTDGGTTFTTIDSINYNGYPSGTFNSNWVTTFQSLSSASGMTNCVIQFVYEDNGAQIIGLALDNILVYDAANTDLGFSSVTPAAGSAADYFLVGSSVTFSGTVTNYGNAAVSSFPASYQVGTGSVVTNTISTSVPALGTATFNYTTPYIMSSATSYPVSLWVSAAGDDNLSNDSITTAVVGVNFFPHKKVLFEEGTGTWCGYCVRGIVFMDSLWKNYQNDVSIVSVHDNGGYDVMATENSCTDNYDTYISSQISGYPSMVIDRTYTDDPSGALIDLVADSAEFGFATMALSGEDTLRNEVIFTASVTPALNLSGNYNLQFSLEEDSVTNTTGGCSGGWMQHDYYGNPEACSVSNGAHSTPLYGCGYNFNDSETAITAGSIKFPFVARWTLPVNVNSTPNGISGSLPATMTSGTTYTYTDSIAIASDWNYKHLRLVAMLIDDNASDPNYGQVLNTANLSFEPQPAVVSHVGVNNVNTAITDMKLFPNPTDDIAHVQFTLNEQTNVQFSVYDAVGRLVFNQPSEMMSEGGQQINFSTANYPSGVYTVVVRTDNGMMTQALSVVR